MKYTEYIKYACKSCITDLIIYKSKQKLKYSNLQTTNILFAEVRTNTNKCQEKNKKKKTKFNHILFPSLPR